jgi:hypothetical protein
MTVRFAIFVVIVFSSTVLAEPTSAASPQLVGGPIAEDTEWRGEVLITQNVVVQPRVRLTIHPGAYIRFHHCRGYRQPERRLSLVVRGSMTAKGTAQRPIYFTSDATTPLNGDWSMVRLMAPTGPSNFEYCVFEFAQQGLNVWKASPRISNCVFRWNNWEGVYFESFCRPLLESCHIYENGYNGLAAE